MGGKRGDGRKQDDGAARRGAAGFDAYYGAVFGERWPALREALLGPTRSIPYCLKLEAPYYLDVASALAAASLPLGGARRILDLCAAPGGKTLVLASLMDADAELLSNERSSERRARLHRVLDAHLGADLRGRVSVAGRDGATWSRLERDAYDRILLDAPCSSERHVLSSPSHLERWSPSRIRTLAQGEWALLSGAFLVLAEGGELLYATCALSDAENDDVVARLVAKYGDAVEILDPDLEGASAVLRGLPGRNAGESFPTGTAEASVATGADAAAVARAPAFEGAALVERTAHGCRVLPDVADGAGPLYFARIRKRRGPGRG